MRNQVGLAISLAILLSLSSPLLVTGQAVQSLNPGQSADRPRDPAAEATTVRAVPSDRPEQQLTEHDRSDAFDTRKPAPVSPALKGQPKEGRITGFDFARDPLNADKPFTTLRGGEEQGIGRPAGRDGRPAQAAGEPLRPRPRSSTRWPRCLAASRCCVGPTARLAEGMTFETAGEPAAGGDQGARALPLPVAAASRCMPTAARSSPRCRPPCSPGSSGSTSSSTSPTSSCPSSRRPSSSRTARSWATSPAARS